MTIPKKSNRDKKPFKLTRELIKLALNDGWTQTEIAEKCRTNQSVVSAWKKGTRKANEGQIKPLLELYGHKLRRKTFKVYWSLDAETEKHTFYRVEGRVILSESFCDARRDARAKLVKKIPLQKIVVHHQGADQFIVIKQHRLKFKAGNSELENSNQDAIWVSEISKPMNSTELLIYVDNYAKKILFENKYVGDATTLPFLIRQALLNHGIPVEGVVEFPAVW